METIFKKLDEKSFQELEAHVILQNEETDRAFGAIEFGNSKYKLAWQSDNLSPYILNLFESVYLIAVDLNLVIIDLELNKKIKSLNLDYFFYEAKIHLSLIYIFTELEILIFSSESFNLVKRVELPEFYEKAEFNDKKVKIYCLNGDVINL